MVHRIRVAVLLAAFLGTLFAPSSASFADSSGLPPHGFTQTDACVVQTAPVGRWRIGGAVRAWNAAQPYVHLSMGEHPGCDVIEIGEFAGPEHPDWNGYTDWSRTVWETSPTYGRVAYHRAYVLLNHALLMYSLRPGQKGTKRACWRKSVVAHEIGHALGLEHATGSESVMSPERDYERFCGAPSVADAAAVASLYTPVA